MATKLTTQFRVWRRPHPDRAPDEMMCTEPGVVDKLLPAEDLLASYIASFYRRGFSILQISRETDLSIPTVRRYLEIANDLIPVDEQLNAWEAGQDRPGPTRKLMLGGVLPPEDPDGR